MTACRLLITLMTTAVSLLAADAARADDNDDLETRIAALIGSHNFALPISFVPDPVFGIPASAVTFGTNLGLKDTRAIFVTPGDWADWPNSDDGCHYEFDLPQSTAGYNNLLGFITLEDVPGNWGELTRDGQVFVAHANTGVNVHAISPYILPDWFESQSIELPSGYHPIEWRAETQISDAFDIIIPAALLLYNSIKYGAAVANQGWSAARQAASQNAARETIKNIALNTGLVTAAQLFEGRTSVVHERDQQITIYKQVPPEISTSQPLITLEATDFGGVLYQRVASDLRATIDAFDPCGKPFTLGNDAGPLLNIGNNELTWTVRDSGPLPGGGHNSDFVVQQVAIEDTQAPIMVPPPSRVIEVPAADSGLDADEVHLGAARVVDLADPDPAISNDGPNFYPIDSRSAITWTATDDSGNSSFGDQLITIKAEGTNSAPTVNNVAASTLTSEPVDFILTGSDPDFLDGRFDPFITDVVDDHIILVESQLEAHPVFTVALERRDLTRRKRRGIGTGIDSRLKVGADTRQANPFIATDQSFPFQNIVIGLTFFADNQRFFIARADCLDIITQMAKQATHLAHVGGDRLLLVKLALLQGGGFTALLG